MAGQTALKDDLPVIGLARRGRDGSGRLGGGFCLEGDRSFCRSRLHRSGFPGRGGLHRSGRLRRSGCGLG